MILRVIRSSIDALLLMADSLIHCVCRTKVQFKEARGSFLSAPLIKPKCTQCRVDALPWAEFQLRASLEWSSFVTTKENAAQDGWMWRITLSPPRAINNAVPITCTFMGHPATISLSIIPTGRQGWRASFLSRLLHHSASQSIHSHTEWWQSPHHGSGHSRVTAPCTISRHFMQLGWLVV